MKQETKIFEGGMMADCLERCLSEGYLPATVEEAWKWKKRNGYTSWIDTSTLFMDGKIRKATLKELINLNQIYGRGGRLLILTNDYHLHILDGDDDLDNGRFLGILTTKKINI